MTGADCGDSLPGEERVAVGPTVIMLLRKFLLPLHLLLLS